MEEQAASTRIGIYARTLLSRVSTPTGSQTQSSHLKDFQIDSSKNTISLLSSKSTPSLTLFRFGVTAVFNLQEPGEHPYCGDRINNVTGFSYTPENLMKNGIAFFNFYWKDLTNPTYETAIRVVQVIDFQIQSGGKVLVHCHAGQGRTALVIGCYLLCNSHSNFRRSSYQHSC